MASRGGRGGGRGGHVGVSSPAGAGRPMSSPSSPALPPNVPHAPHGMIPPATLGAPGTFMPPMGMVPGAGSPALGGMPGGYPMPVMSLYAGAPQFIGVAPAAGMPMAPFAAPFIPAGAYPQQTGMAMPPPAYNASVPATPAAAPPAPAAAPTPGGSAPTGLMEAVRARLEAKKKAAEASPSSPAPAASAPAPAAETPVAAPKPPAATPVDTSKLIGEVQKHVQLKSASPAAGGPSPAPAPAPATVFMAEIAKRAAAAPAPAPPTPAAAPAPVAAPTPAPAPKPAPAPAPASAPVPSTVASAPPAGLPGISPMTAPAEASAPAGAGYQKLMSQQEMETMGAESPATPAVGRMLGVVGRAVLEPLRKAKQQYSVAELKQLFDAIETQLLRITAAGALPGFKSHKLLVSGGGGGGRGYGGDEDWDSGDRRRKGGGYGKGRGFMRHDDFDEELGPDPYVLLGKAKNAWSKRKDEVDAAEKTVGTVRSLLNRISKETFDKLSDEILAQPVTSQDMLERIIDVVFDKALDDVFFQDLYAELCKKLGERAVMWSHAYLVVRELDADSGPAGAGWYIDMSGKGQWQGPYETQEAAKSEGLRLTNFKRLLLNRCQQEFQKENQYKPLDAEQLEDEARRAAGGLKKEDEDALKRRAEVRAEKRGKIKRRMLANISFIGQLYMIEGMLTGPIMHFCIARLLNNGDVANPDEQNVEALCKLLFTIGRKFDKEDSVSKEPRMNTYAGLISSISTNPKVSSRVRFMCKDLIDCRNNGWVLRGAMASIEKRTDTKTRDEVRKLILEEEAQKAAALANPDAKRAGPTSARSTPVARPITPASSGPARQPTGPTGRGPATFMPTRGGRATPAGGRPSPAAAAASADGWKTVGPRGTAASGVAAPSPSAADEASAASAEAPASPSPAPAAEMREEILSGTALRKRVHAILEEYAAIKSADELERSVMEIRGSDAWSGVMTTDALTYGYTAKDDFRLGAGAALRALAEKNLLVKSDVMAALAAFSTVFVEAIVDAPKIGEYTAQVLSPLCAEGFIAIPELAPFLHAVAATGVAGVTAAVVLANMVADNASHFDAIEAAAKSHALSLVALTLPGMNRAKKVRDALGPRLAEVFPELDALHSICGAVSAAVTEGEDAADALVAAVHSAPANARSRWDFARGIAAEATREAAQNSDGDESAFKSGLANAGRAIRAALGYAEAAEPANETAPGFAVLNGIQVYAATDDELDPKAVAWAFESLLNPGADGIPVVKPGSFKAWIDAQPVHIGAAPTAPIWAEPVGREAAVAATGALATTINA